jgi:hypothetical protein
LTIMPSVSLVPVSPSKANKSRLSLRPTLPVAPGDVRHIIAQLSTLRVGALHCLE